MIHQAHFGRNSFSDGKLIKQGFAGRIIAAIAHCHTIGKKRGSCRFPPVTGLRNRIGRAGFPARLAKYAGGAANQYGEFSSGNPGLAISDQIPSIYTGHVTGRSRIFFRAGTQIGGRCGTDPTARDTFPLRPPLGVPFKRKGPVKQSFFVKTR
jgi:hypothetical protein